ncbi:unnamed protein product [Lota lota]
MCVYVCVCLCVCVCVCVSKRESERVCSRVKSKQQRSTIKMNHLLRLSSFRSFSSTSRQLRNKVPDAQKVFQEDNGLPVHIKGGTSDVLLYRATMTLTLAGTGYSIYWLLHASFPQKKV